MRVLQRIFIAVFVINKVLAACHYSFNGHMSTDSQNACLFSNVIKTEKREAHSDTTVSRKCDNSAEVGEIKLQKQCVSIYTNEVKHFNKVLN